MISSCSVLPEANVRVMFANMIFESLFTQRHNMRQLERVTNNLYLYKNILKTTNCLKRAVIGEMWNARKFLRMPELRASSQTCRSNILILYRFDIECHMNTYCFSSNISLVYESNTFILLIHYKLFIITWASTSFCATMYMYCTLTRSMP